MTRREWSPAHAAKFKAGMLVDAWDRSPRTRQGRKVATIRIVREPYQQMSDALHPLDYRDEGFVWLDDHGEGVRVRMIVEDWNVNARLLWVVQFELVEVVR